MNLVRRLLILSSAGLTWNASPAATTDTDVLRLAIEKDYAPFVFSGTNGEPQGLSIDILQLVLRQTGLQVRPLPAQPLSILLDDLRLQRADLITSLRSTPERAKFLLFSRPYIEVPAILVVGSSVSNTDARSGLRALADRPVAVGKGYGVEQPMRQRFPAVRWQAVDDDAIALRGVSEGRFDGAVADAASVAYLIRREGLSNLRAAGRVGFDYELSFALSKQHASLLPEINQGIQSIPRTDRQAVIDRWMGNLDLDAFDGRPQWVFWGGGVLFLFGAGLITRRWRQRRESPSDIKKDNRSAP